MTELNCTDVLFLWDVSEADFTHWVERVCVERCLLYDDQIVTYVECQQQMKSVKEDLERSGVKVRLVLASIQEMQDMCCEIGVEYTSLGRARAIYFLGVKKLLASG